MDRVYGKPMENLWKEKRQSSAVLGAISLGDAEGSRGLPSLEIRCSNPAELWGHLLKTLRMETAMESFMES